MKITIIVPVYNVALYIADCLHSVMRQTYTGDMECLLIDDATPDDSVAIAERSLKQYEGHICFRIIHHERNQGLSAARNTGVREATGDYLFFLDGDDIISDDCVGRMVNEICKHPAAELVQGNMQDSDSLLLVKKHMLSWTESNAQIRSSYYRHRQLLVNACNKLIKRSFIIDHQLFFKQGIIYEDMLWTFYLLKHVSAMSFIPDVTYHYILHQNSIIRGAKKNQAVHFYSIIFHEIINNLTPHYEKEEIKYYTCMYCSQHVYIDRTNAEYKELFPLFWQQARQHNCWFSLYMLAIARVAVRFKHGRYLVSLLYHLKLYPLKFA